MLYDLSGIAAAVNHLKIFFYWPAIDVSSNSVAACQRSVSFAFDMGLHVDSHVGRMHIHLIDPFVLTAP